MSLALVAWRNLFRNLVRALMTAAGVAVAVLAFMTIRTVLVSWNAGAEQAASDRLATRHKVSFVIPLPKHYIDTIRQIPGVKAATFASWFGGKDPRQPDLFFAKFAVDTDSFFDVTDEMAVAPDALARWKENRRGIIIGEVLARQLNLKVGDRLTIEGDIYPGNWEFEVSGVYEAKRRTVDQSSLMFHWNYLNDSLPEGRRDTIGWVMSRIDDSSRTAAISADIDRVFDEKDEQTVTMNEQAFQASFLGMFSAMLSALDIVSFIILLIMMLILGNTIAMGVRERTNEYGVLRALGFSPRHIAGFIAGEAVLLGLVGGVLGLALSYPIVELGLGRYLEENMAQWFPYFRLDGGTVALALGMSVVLAGVASILPALGASRLPVTEALRRVG